MRERFGLVTGLSDHTIDNTTAVTSVALGASIIEKHFTLDRNGGGPDDSFSLEPADLMALCRDIVSPKYKRYNTFKPSKVKYKR